MLQTVDLLGVKVSRVNLNAAKDHICQWVINKTRVYVCVAPASTLVDAKRNKAYCDVINQAAMVTPDGVPVVWLARLKGCRDIERTYGPDLLRLMCAQAGLRHYFFGSTTEVIRLLNEQLKTQFPRIVIAGQQSPPYRAVAAIEHDNVIDAINQVRPDILWVGLGSPKQDHWMALNRSRLNVPVIIAVGAAFDFLAGTKPQAPRWMQRCGLEWLFRFSCEPGRLWKRYVFGNSLYVMYALKELISKKP